MSKFKELKDYVRGHIPQIVGTVAGIIAVILVCVIIIILNSEVKNDNGQIETTKKQALETTVKNEETKETVTKQTKATTKTDGTTTEETSKEENTTEQATKKQEETKRQQEAATNVQVVTTQQHTTTKTQTVVQPTTKKQEATTKKPETPTTPPRGKNGVILEELSFDRWNYSKRVHESVPVPKTYTEYKNNASNKNAIGYAILYDDYKIRDDIFYNELTFKKSTEQDIINIYGKPKVTYYYDKENNKYITYQYGYYANGVEEDIIYIRFCIWSELGNTLGAISIGNADALGLEEYLK